MHVYFMENNILKSVISELNFEKLEEKSKLNLKNIEEMK